MLYLTFLLQVQPNPFLSLLPFVLVVGIFYFLVLLPMQKQKKQQRQMLESIRNGNVVQTAGGIIGTVVSRNDEDDTLVLRIKPDNIKIQVARTAVAGLISEK